MADALRRLVTVECKALPTMKPLSVFLQKLQTADANKTSKNDDQHMLDFIAFRGGVDSNGTSSNNSKSQTNPAVKNFSIASTSSFTPPVISAWPPQRTAKKKLIMFCDSSILMHRQLSQLQLLARHSTQQGDGSDDESNDGENVATASSSSSADVLSFVFPFSSLLLLRMQAAQTDSGAVSNAFCVTVFSQLRQLTHFGQQDAVDERKSANERTSSPLLHPPPPVCVLQPSREAELLRSVGITQLPDSLAAKSVIGGEASAAALLLPRLALAAQRSFGAEEGKSCVAAVGSLHPAVHSVCMRAGIFCDSLFAGGSDEARRAGSAGDDEQSQRRHAASLCRSYVKKLQNVAPNGQSSGL